MTPTRLVHRLILGTAVVALFGTTAAQAQRGEGTPEQRIERLEKQVQQVQRQVFPKGRPADTAGFADDPAATQSSVTSLAGRLDSLERQMADLVRMSEESANRLRTQEADIIRMREEQDRKIVDLEARLASAPPAAASTTPASTSDEPATKAKPKPVDVASSPKPKASAATEPAATSSAAPPPADVDPIEAAYTEGFKLWEGGQYEESITVLRRFVAANPKHRRTSFANNLIGRALLDKGDARAAIPAFIANYKNDPAGERAPDSLYYLGQALMKLGQPAQACNAYAELDEVYGIKMRPELKKLQIEARQQAQCKE